MSATDRCDNPMCTCSPCSCVQCRCGVARLGELERRVMEILWEIPGREVTVRQVADRLPGYAYTTVATVLDRLTHKGLVHRRREGRTIRFMVTGTPAAHTAMLMHEMLEVTSDPEGTLVCFAEIVSASEADTLRRAFEERASVGPVSTDEWGE